MPAGGKGGTDAGGLILPFAVFLWGALYALAEEADEIRAVIKADLSGDLVDFHIGVAQEIARALTAWQRAWR